MPTTCRYFTARHKTSGPANRSVISHMSWGHTWKNVTTRSATHSWKTKTRMRESGFLRVHSTNKSPKLRIPAVMKMIDSTAMLP